MKKKSLMWSVLLILVITPQITQAMHIMEGFLPLKWAIAWSVLTLPFLAVGLKKVAKGLREEKDSYCWCSCHEL